MLYFNARKCYYNVIVIEENLKRTDPLKEWEEGREVRVLVTVRVFL
jgi:hypothetical protein